MLYGPVNSYELQPFRKHSLLLGTCDLLHEECKWYVKFAFTLHLQENTQTNRRDILRHREIPNLCKPVSGGEV